MRARVADTVTRLVHVVLKAPAVTDEKGIGYLLCEQPFVWDSAPPWYVEKVLKTGAVVGSRRSYEAIPTCLQCVARDGVDDDYP
jgi:hypothetical protein